MKKYIIRSFTLTIVLVVLSNCKKMGKDYDTYFYTDVENSAGPLTLYVDGNSKGALPNLKTSCSASNDTVIFNALHLVLKSGKYKVEAKDAQGKVMSSGTIKFRSHSLSSSGGTGGQAVSSSGDKIVTKLYY